MKNEIYFDNASTSYPKSIEAIEAIEEYLLNAGCSPGRAGYKRARESEKRVDNSRKLLAKLLGCKEYEKIVFTYNATIALNMVIKGYLKRGDKVVTTCFEHNSVIRPLEDLKRKRIITYEVIGLKDSVLDIEQYKKSITKKVKLVVINHASNVTGIVNPIKEMIDYAHVHGAKVLVDASQTAGFLEIEIDKTEVDFLVFTGHKALGGLPGIGGFFAKESNDLATIIQGGTGSNSHSLVQPGFSPEKFEAGTCNYTGIVALGAGVNMLLGSDRKEIRKNELHNLVFLTDRLKQIKEVRLYGDATITAKVPVLSFNIEGIPAGSVSTILDDKYGIMTRPGLQCAPLLHKELGTFPGGTVRISLSNNNTLQECIFFINAITEIVNEKKQKEISNKPEEKIADIKEKKLRR